MVVKELGGVGGGWVGTGGRQVGECGKWGMGERRRGGESGD